MREFNQASLDARLAEIAGNLTPEQAIRVKERVRERIAGSNLDFTPEAIDGAFNLIGAIASRTISLPNLGAAGERLSSMLGTLDLRHISLPVGDMAGQAGAALTRMAGGLGRVWGAVHWRCADRSCRRCERRDRRFGRQRPGRRRRAGECSGYRWLGGRSGRDRTRSARRCPRLD